VGVQYIFLTIARYPTVDTPLPNIAYSNVVLRPVLVLRPFFEVLDGLKDLKNCGLKTKKSQDLFRPKRS